MNQSPKFIDSPIMTERARKLMKLAQQQVLVFDGAMGTQIHALELPDESFGGIPDCPEMLNLASPDAVYGIHKRFFEAGADIVETNTFGGSVVTLSEFGVEDRALEINKRAAEIARRAAEDFSKEHGRPCFVSGSIGPGTKLPSLGHIDFDTLREGLQVQAEGLLLGGVDILQVETCQDILQIKAAVIGAIDAIKKHQIQVPICVQFTVETTGTLLLGTEVAAAFTTFEPYDEIWAFGLNCATGPTHMRPHLQTLAELTDKAINCLPNAGLPQNVDGQVVYPLEGPEFGEQVAGFVRDLGINLVGGCCGTTPAHITELKKAVKGIVPKQRQFTYENSAASLYGGMTLSQTPPPLMVGERLNANGSRKFKKLLKNEDFDGMVEMAKSQMKGGAHLLDVCVAFTGRDEVRDMKELLTRLRGQSQLPLVIDSTEVNVIEQALKMLPGRAVVNSINLEDGEAKPREVLKLCKRYGAAVIALTIDEEGQAYDAAGKLRIAKRLYNLCLDEGLRPTDIIFDPLTFTLGTGRDEYRKVGIETLEGIRQIKKECPGALTILGLSNCSFGLNPAARQVLNSVFLAEAVKAGLDQAIVHASKILPMFKIPENEQRLALDLVYDRQENGDPLMLLLALFEDRKAVKGAAKERPDTIEEVLSQRIIDGDRKGLGEDLDTALEKYKPFEIINQFLLDGMKVVGELFGSGKMQLPFVLQSAEVMKAAVKHLEPHMETTEVGGRGKVLLATVKGDVHDIGKNLVDIILSNNGFEVVNIGIKQPVDAILKAAEDHKVDIIGLSGLLVKSTVVMRDNLLEMNRRNQIYPVILGGAALTRKYVEVDLRKEYEGAVAYAPDAFAGLSLVTRVCEQKLPLVEPSEAAAVSQIDKAPKPVEFSSTTSTTSATATATLPTRSKVKRAAPIAPPFWGPKLVKKPFEDQAEIFNWVNKNALFRGQWQFRRGGKTRAEQLKFEAEEIEPLFEQYCREALEIDLFEPQVAYGYFPCRADGNNLIIYNDPEGKSERATLTFPRQQSEKALCLSDYFHDEQIDCIAFSAVTVGLKASTFTEKLFKSDEYKRYFMFHGLSVECAEGLAEYWHKKIREELGIAGEDAETPAQLFRQQYRGLRYSFGYPACPDLSMQKVVFDLIPAAEIGLQLTEECQLVPEQSTTALVVHHPQARYFGA